MELTDAIRDWVAARCAEANLPLFLHMRLEKPADAGADLQSVDVRPILVKRVLKLSFTYHYRTRDIVKNYTPEESTAELLQLFVQFKKVTCRTTAADYTVNAAGIEQRAPRETVAASLQHDRSKQHLVTSDRPYLQALGIANAQGKLRADAQDKFRQINKYIEVLDGLVAALPQEKLRIVDMGAGKGYLTFALYDYLTQNGRIVEVTGVEYRHDLVEKCNAIARNAEMHGLKFVQGTIDGFDCAGADVVIALHACDTATDDAIAKAVKAAAALIVVAPCCHKQVRRAMEKSMHAPALDAVLKHGTFMERSAEMVTDAMRAQLMELSGYRTKLFEFISDAHTPKNVLIVGEKHRAPDAVKQAELQAGLAALKTEFGVSEHYLEKRIFTK